MGRVDRVAIVGVGLIGGSLGMALKAKGIARRVIGIGRSKGRLLRARDLKAVDEVSIDFKAGVRDADVVVLATPVGVIPQIARRIVPHLKEGSIISDVGSVKSCIVQEIEEFLPPETYFVGGHPMAGSERRGVSAADLKLFEGTICCLTPTDRTNPDALGLIKDIWEGVGAEVMLIPPSQHDLIAGGVSHLPHIIAVALVNMAGDLGRDDERVFNLIAGGFRDATRIAASHPILWRDICLANREVILKMISRFKSVLSRMESMISGLKSDQLLKELERAQGLRLEKVKDDRDQG